jgi:hypothetical protein
MRRIVLLLVAMILTLVVASGVARGVNKIGTNNPDTLRGTDPKVSKMPNWTFTSNWAHKNLRQ